MMRNKSHLTREDGYQWLRPHVKTYYSELVSLLQGEDDISMKVGILDLLTASGMSEAFIIFVEYFFSPEYRLQDWAKTGIIALKKTSEGRKKLWDAYLAAIDVPPIDTLEGQRIHDFIGQILAPNR